MLIFRVRFLFRVSTRKCKKKKQHTFVFYFCSLLQHLDTPPYWTLRFSARLLRGPPPSTPEKIPVCSDWSATSGLSRHHRTCFSINSAMFLQPWQHKHLSTQLSTHGDSNVALFWVVHTWQTSDGEFKKKNKQCYHLKKLQQCKRVSVTSIPCWIFTDWEHNMEAHEKQMLTEKRGVAGIVINQCRETHQSWVIYRFSMATFFRAFHLSGLLIRRYGDKIWYMENICRIKF